MPAPKTTPISHEVTAPAGSFVYQLKYSKRRSVGFTVYPDRTVTVTAPKGVPVEHVHRIVVQKSDWIVAKLKKFENYVIKESAAKITDGAAVYHLGRQYQMKVVKAVGRPEAIEVKRRYIEVYSRAPKNKQRLTAQFEKWQRNQAEELFPPLLETCARRMVRFGIQTPPLRLRKMKSRWGSCNSQGIVTLNTKLIHADPHLVEYVIYHELCHLKEMNHSKAFYNYLVQVCPDWKALKKELNEFVI